MLGCRHEAGPSEEHERFSRRATLEGLRALAARRHKGSVSALLAEIAAREAKFAAAEAFFEKYGALPLDEEAILATVRKTNKVLVLTEEQLTGSVAGEVSARIAEGAFAWLDGPVHRLCCPDTPVPYSPTLEEAYLPNVDKLIARVRELASW